MAKGLSYRLVESKLWLADTAFISLSHCRQDCSAEFMLDPSLTHAYSAFPLNGQGTKLHNMISIYNQEQICKWDVHQ